MGTQERLRVALVSVQRPIFRGDKGAVWRRSVTAIEDLSDPLGLAVIVAADPVTDGEQAAATSRWLADIAPDLTLVQATTFATADAFLPLLTAGSPTALWAVPEPTTSGPLPLNSFCGVNFVCSLGPLGQLGERPVKWLLGEAGEQGFRERLAVTCRALAARRALASSRLLALGGTAPTFARFAAEAATFGERFGVTVESLDLETLFHRVAEVSQDDAVAAGQAMAAEAAACRLSDDQLAAAGRLDLALARLVAEGGYDALALRCWPECAERCGVMPCASVARLFDAGRPAACEGDVLGAISLLALQSLGDGRTVLLDLSHVAPEAVQFWHCGNAPGALADADGFRLEAHFNRPDTGAVRAQRLAPGPTTMLRFTSVSELAAMTGEWVRHEGGFDGVSGWLTEAHWEGSRRLSPADLAATVLDRGLPHHFPFAPGHLAEEALELGAWLGLRSVPAASWRAGLLPAGAES